MAKKYIKDMSRDAVLILIELWYYCETIGFKKWYGQSCPYKPYIFFENKLGLCDAYYDPEGIDWVIQYASECIQKDPYFIHTFINNYKKLYKELEYFWLLDRPLRLSELKRFYNSIKETMTGLEISYRIPYAPDDLISQADRNHSNQVRRDTEKLFDYSDRVFRATLSNLYPQLETYSKYLTFNEVTTGNLPDLDILKKRHEFYIYTDRKLYVDVSATEVENMYNIIVDRDIIEDNTTIIKGSIACKGKITGCARVVRTKDAIVEVNEGDILVAPMTTPDYLPAMKKAAAFVTDEGGITCHAAIVAREMQKPCIIGTKIATQVLKDGDMVEVNADEGVVRIIS